MVVSPALWRSDGAPAALPHPLGPCGVARHLRRLRISDLATLRTGGLSAANYAGTRGRTVKKDTSGVIPLGSLEVRSRAVSAPSLLALTVLTQDPWGSACRRHRPPSRNTRHSGGGWHSGGWAWTPWTAGMRVVYEAVGLWLTSRWSGPSMLSSREQMPITRDAFDSPMRVASSPGSRLVVTMVRMTFAHRLSSKR